MKTKQKSLRTLKFIRLGILLIAVLLITVLVFSTYYFFENARQLTNLKLANQTARITRGLLLADKYGYLRDTLRNTKLLGKNEDFVITLQDNNNPNAIQIKSDPEIDLSEVKKILESIKQDEKLLVSLYLPKAKKWAIIYNEAGIIFTRPNIVLRMVTTVIIPTIIAIILVYLLFLSFKQIFIRLLTRKVTVEEPVKTSDDITPFRNLEDEIQKLKNKIKDAINEKTLMLLALSHDINTPIMKLRLYADELRDKEMQYNIVRELDYLTNVTESSMAIGDESKVKKCKVDVASMLAYLKESQYQSEDDVVFYFPDTPFCIEGMPELIKRAVINLVENSLKYAEKVEVKLVMDKKLVEIVVEDNGPGLPEEEIERLLKPFQQLNDTSSGSGLGLAIVNKIMLLHGGSLHLANRKPTGMQARLRFT